MHARLSPKQYRFKHRVFMFFLDLDELPALEQSLPMFSQNRLNWYSFYGRDHLPGSDQPLKAKVLNYLSSQNIHSASVTRVMLLTNLRVLGYVFNPVSFYFCFDEKSRCLAAVAEVGNTFGEMKLYLVRPAETESSQLHQRETKFFYVSPFSDLDMRFEFRLAVPEAHLSVSIDTLSAASSSGDDNDSAAQGTVDHQDKVLRSVLEGKRVPLTPGKLSLVTLRYPLMTLKVIILIHWHAMRLMLQRVRFHAKETNPGLQQHVLRPHRSLTR